MAGTPATLGPPPFGDEVATIVGPSRRAAHEGLALAPGFRLGHFEVIDAIGSGGMATVLKARDLELGRIVALKILPPDSARDPDSVTRFKQEARAAAKLDHDNVARVFFCGEEKGLHFIAFEYVEGETLRALIERHTTLPPADCIRYLLQLAAGLQHASDRGVIHRDVKPSNIVITPDGKAKLIDMGLARQQGSQSVNGGVTQSGMTLGTFDYISPEQALDPRSVDVRSDIYSLGCAFYHALTGRPPVPEGTAAKKLHAHQHEPPTDPRQLNPLVPDALAAVLSTMMVKNRDRRYASPDALIRDLLAVAESLELVLDPNIIPAGPSRSGNGQVRALAGNSKTRVPVGLAIGLAVAVASIGIAIVTLGRGNKPIPQPGDDDFGRAPSTARILDLPTPNQNGPQPAVKQTVRVGTVEALIAALAQSNVTIQLEAGKVYDLSDTAGASYQGRELVIETQPGPGPATLKLAAAPVSDEAPRAIREGTLNLIGADSVRIRGVKLLIAQKPGSAEESLTGLIGLLADGVGKLELAQCQIELDGAATASNGVGVLVARGGRAEPTKVTAQNVVVALRRWVGIEFAGGAAADFTECGFATSRAAVSLTGQAANASLGFHFCTVLLDKRGVGVDVRDTVAASIRAGFSVFASGNTDPPAMMMMPDPNEFKPAVLRVAAGATGIAAPIPDQASAFYRVEIPANWDAPRDLKQHPWAGSAPTAKLDSPAPWKAFELNPRWNQLRLPGRTDVQILGVKQLPDESTKIYGTWPPGGNPIDALPPGVKVWYPNPPAAEKDSLPTNVFENLAQAMAALKPNDKLLIRGPGPIEVPTLIAIAKPDFNATIRPEDPNASLVLFAAEPNRLDSAMFRLEEGDIRFERIDFRLKPTVSKAGDMASQSVVAMAGGRKCEFHQCTITMEQQKDEILTAVALIDDSLKMRKTEPIRRPMIRMQDCVVRGRGRALWATSAFPFDFAATNCLIGLAAPVVELEAPAKPLPNGATAGIQLTNVTALLGGALIDLRCGKPSDDKPGPYLPVEIRTDGCLFIPVGTAPLAIVAGGDASLWDRYVTWNIGTASGYGNFPETATMIEVTSADSDGKGKRVDIDGWLQFTKMKPASFGKAALAKLPDNADGLGFLLPEDAAVKESPFGLAGCRPKDLPKLGK